MFIICSKKDNLGSHPDWQSLHNHFELGWEVAATHIDAKYLFATKAITPQNDVIVSLSGREFLYSKLMPVMSYEEFARQRKITDASRVKELPDVNDLTHVYACTSWINTDIYHGGPEKRYKYEALVKDLYGVMDTPPVDHLAADPFYLCCWRYRNNHSTGRNTPPDTAAAIHAHLLKQTKFVYVVGLGAEPLCDGQRVIHIDLPTFAALASHANCKAVVGAMTGTMQLGAILCKTCVGVYQHNDKVPEANEVNHPVVFGECVNFNRNKRCLFYQPRTPVNEFLAHLDSMTGAA